MKTAFHNTCWLLISYLLVARLLVARLLVARLLVARLLLKGQLLRDVGKRVVELLIEAKVAAILSPLVVQVTHVLWIARLGSRRL